MQQAKAESKIITSAILVFSVWAFRTLYETGKTVGKAAGEQQGGLKQLAGLTAHPAHPAQFIVGFGFVFFVLSVAAMGAPEAAGNFAILIAVGSTLANGVQLFTDIGNATGGAAAAEKGSTTELLTNVPPGENQKVRAHA